MILTCYHCKKDFSSATSKRKYCSIPCFREASPRKHTTHDPYNLEFIKRRGEHIKSLLGYLRRWFVDHPYPIELRKISYGFAAGCKQYGGLNQILLELEVDGLVDIEVVETKLGLVQTIMMTEFKRKEERA